MHLIDTAWSVRALQLTYRLQRRDYCEASICGPRDRASEAASDEDRALEIRRGLGRRHFADAVRYRAAPPARAAAQLHAVREGPCTVPGTAPGAAEESLLVSAGGGWLFPPGRGYSRN